MRSDKVVTLAGQWPTEPVTCPDPSDGKLSHLDGLNLSRAAILHAIAEALGDPPAMSAHAQQHAGAHWLASFAMYLETKRWRVTV